MLHLAILLLASAGVTLCSHINHEYHLINMKTTWDKAQTYCRNNHVDLATIRSHDDMKRLVDTAAAGGVTDQVWIGLQKSGAASWMWSVGETQTTHGLPEYTNWARTPDSSHHCGGMRRDGKWVSQSCDTTHHFVCQDYEGSGGMYVVFQQKSWRQAQRYCRLNNTDLVSVRSPTESEAVRQVVGPTLNFVWTGLFRDEWKWSDQSDSSFRYWDSSQPNGDGHCTLYSPTGKTWYDRGCTTLHRFYCNVEVTRQIVRLEMESSSLNFGDPAVSEALLNEIQKKFEGAKFQWRVQPDGKIFHKKEKKKENKVTC